MDIVKGMAASAGIGIGRALVLCETLEADVGSSEPSRGAKKEQARLDAAIAAFCEESAALAARLFAQPHEAEILQGHVLMLRDPFMMSGMRERIKRGESAVTAVCGMCDTYIGIFESAEDELTQQRAADVRDIKRRLVALLTGKGAVDLSRLPPDTVLVVDELTPSQTAGLDRAHITGIVAQGGGMTSHAAILARAMGLPCVLRVKNATTLLKNGDMAALDGSSGAVYIEPDEQTLAALRETAEREAEEKERLREMIGRPTKMADGTKKEIFANIGGDREVADALQNGAEGVGLFRTEFLFMDRRAAPDEEAQYAAYRAAAAALRGKPLVVRTLDVGGDKPIAYLPAAKEENPFLGVRGIRHSLLHQELLKTQLRAILRAAADGAVRILFPMVSDLAELRAAKACLQAAREELLAQGARVDVPVPLGMMVETPAACLMAEQLAAEVDFFSIGTNDLVQYVMAADRGNAQVTQLYQVYQPAVLRALERVIGAAKRRGISVSVCGEAAADPVLTPVLLAFGVDDFSVVPRSVPMLRAEIGRWDRDTAQRVASEVLMLDTAEAVRARLQTARTEV